MSLKIHCEHYLEGKIDFDRSYPLDRYVPPSFRAEEKSSVDIKVMEIEFNYQKFLRYNFLRTIKDHRMDFFTLPENQNPPPSIINPVTSESSGCSEQTNGPD
ncbi:hypothetical protein AYI69_g4096 [Smittium culicis]|uniref:Uncharacterized protein n=1 Tax=Smittium culicis TaxID=133412 RepID=A0A1R1YGI9_9FUNG|nr:hypothetical protein AYI69_g4096 [Smittium culicis]